MRASQQVTELSALEQNQALRVDRYAMCGEIAVGGAGSVHVGRVAGPGGFVRLIAIKRLHPHLSRDAKQVEMFLEEARVASRIRHPNVISPIDVVLRHGEPFMVMDYVEGLTLAEVLTLERTRRKQAVPEVATAFMVDVLRGLHAAHEAADAQGQSLDVVHRDVSPPNIMLGRDGIARLLDFGVATTKNSTQSMLSSPIKGRLGYMAPEQLGNAAVDRRADVFAAGVVLWEALTLSRLFRCPTEGETVERTLKMQIPAPSSKNASISAALDNVVLRALARDPAERFQTASEFADAIEQAIEIATAGAVRRWLLTIADVELTRRATLLEEIERSLDDMQRLPEEETPDSVPALHRTRCTPPTTITLPPSNPATNSRLNVWPWLSLSVVAIGLLLTGARLLHVNEVMSFALFEERAPATRAPFDVRAAAKSEPAADLDKLPEPRASAAITSSSEDEIPVWTPTPVTTPAPKPATLRPRKVSRKNQCDPPYTVDDQGIRHIKAGCI